jgi:hypothetical protein
VATVVIAVTGSAFAQSVARPAGTTTATTQPPVKTTGAPAAAANRTSASANPVTTLPNNNGNITSTTVTNADGSTTTTFSNGLTSNSNGVSSSRSGSNMASSASNTPIGSTSANGSATTNESTTGNSSTSANGSSSTNGRGLVGGIGTQGTASNAAGTLLAPGVVTPAIVNGNLGSITSDGERVFDANGNQIDLNSNQVQLVNNGSAGSAITYETVRSGNTAGLDRAIKQTERDRKKIGRNGQLLQTIAPRTNVDRSDQMPDDGPTPALTGSSSTLLKR